MLFEQGDTDHEHVYLLDGSIVLLSDRAVVDKVSAGSDTARFPLAHQLPRKRSACRKTDVRIAHRQPAVERRTGAHADRRLQVSDLGDASEDDWMSMLLQSRVLQQVPASNIQRVMMSVEQVEVASGDDLIRQGDPGDYYYMLTKGPQQWCAVTPPMARVPVSSTLGPGDAFGEEACFQTARNSTVSMLQDGEVLRLSKEDFLDLIHNPLLDRIDMQARRPRSIRVRSGSICAAVSNTTSRTCRAQSISRSSHYVIRRPVSRRTATTSTAIPAGGRWPVRSC